LSEKDSGLDKLLAQAVDLNPAARAQLLYDSTLLEAAHREAGAQGDTSAPDADDSVDLHFVCFVKSANGHLWELDGRRKGPLDRGALDESEDVLSDKALELGVKAFLKREEKESGGDLRFSCVALAPTLE
jgi:ubiquitin carboxyl-terminal hydrolase L3